MHKALRLATLAALGLTLAGCASVKDRGTQPAPAPPTNSAAATDVAPILTVATDAGNPTAPSSPGAIPHHEHEVSHAPGPRSKPDIALANIAKRASESYASGVAWALANQRPDGNWGSFQSPREREIYLDTLASHRAFQTATTALVAWALIDPSHSDARCKGALERGLGCLESRSPPGRASGNTFYDVWSHTYLIELSTAVCGDASLAPRHEAWKAMATREIAHVRREQGTEGGWGYYDFNFTGLHPSGNESTSFNTSAMVLALKGAQSMGNAIPDGTFQDATRAIRRMQLPSGAFVYGTYAQLNPRADYNKVSGSSGRLQVCNVALYWMHAGEVTVETLLRGVQHLRDTHQYIEIGRGRVMPHESFYRNSGYYYYFGHYYAACALSLVPASPQRTELARWLAQVMINDQNPDGSWFDYPLYGYGKAYATGFALLTLEKLRPLLPEPG